MVCGKENQRESKRIKEQLANIPAQSNLHHPIFIQSSSSCEKFLSRFFVPGTAEDPAPVHGAQQVALSTETIGICYQRLTVKYNCYNSKWFSWYDNFWHMVELTIEYGVEWCWMVMNHLLLDISAKSISQDHSAVQPAIDAQRQNWQAAADCRILRGGIFVRWMMLDDLPIFKGKIHYFDWAMFNSYVKLPEGIMIYIWVWTWKCRENP